MELPQLREPQEIKGNKLEGLVDSYLEFVDLYFSEYERHRDFVEWYLEVGARLGSEDLGDQVKK